MASFRSLAASEGAPHQKPSPGFLIAQPAGFRFGGLGTPGAGWCPSGAIGSHLLAAGTGPWRRNRCISTSFSTAANPSASKPLQVLSAAGPTQPPNFQPPELLSATGTQLSNCSHPPELSNPTTHFPNSHMRKFFGKKLVGTENLADLNNVAKILNTPATSSAATSRESTVTNGRRPSKDLECAIGNIVESIESEKVKGKDAHVIAGKMLGIKPRTIRAVICRKNKAQAGLISKKGGGNKPWTAHIDRFMIERIRLIVHEFFKQGHAPTAQEIYDKVIEEFPLPSQFGDGKKNYSISVIYKIMKHLKFAVRKRKGTNLHAIYLRKDIIDWRIRYLKRMAELRSQNNVALIYWDETWATVNMGPDRVWTDLNVLKDPSEAMNPFSGITFGVPGSQGGGKRLIIAHGIIELPDGSHHFVPNSLLAFRSGGKAADYHNEMDSKEQLRWLEQDLIPNVQNIVPAGTEVVYILDNAPYHCSQEADSKVPTSSSRKGDIVQFIQEHQAELDFSDEYIRNLNKKTKQVIYKNYLQPYRKQFLSYQLDTLIQNSGGEVLRLPPYHCDLNPIEKVWYHLKHWLHKNIPFTSTPRKLDLLEEKVKEWFSMPDLSQRSQLDSAFLFSRHKEEEFRELDGISALQHLIVEPLTIDNAQSDSDSDCDSESEFEF